MKSPEKKMQSNIKAKGISLIGVNNYVDRIINALEKRKLFYDDYNYFTPIPKGRPSVLKDFTKESYGWINHPIVDPYSSDDDFQEEEGNIIKEEPSVKEVCEYIFDHNTLMNIVYNFIYF